MLVTSIFSIFPQNFQKPFSGLLKVSIVWQRVNSFPHSKVLDWFKLKGFADVKINVTKKIEISFSEGRKHCGKRRKCWLPAFSPFPRMFSKGFLFSVFKSWDFVVRVKAITDEDLNMV